MGNYQTIGFATDAIIRINLRQSREDALKAVYELQPESVEQGIVEDIFGNPKSFDTLLLLAGATHRSPRVRRAVLPILYSRDALPPDVAEQLLGDSDATVRYYALGSLIAAGKEIPNDRAKAILIKPAPRAGLGLFNPLVPDKDGEQEWTQFLREKLRAANIATLERLAATETIFRRHAHFALEYKQFSKRGDALRRMVDDRFEAEFANELDRLSKRVGVDSDMVTEIKALDEHLRRGWLREGLDILCEKDNSEDLPRIRRALKDGFIEYSKLEIKYLRRHGEWRDIELLLLLAERPISGTSILTAYSNSDATDAIAEAAYSIGKNRFKELLAHPMSDNLLSRILVRASNSDFASLSDDDILEYLAVSSDQIRKLASMKSIRALTRQRLRQIFERYMNRDRRYYNVIHWLDMGISLSKSRAVAAADRVLLKLD